MRKEFFISNRKGQKISVVLYSKTRKVVNKPTIIMCHGFTGSKEEMWFPILFNSLIENDYQVLSFDMNGHGSSYGYFRDFTVSKAAQDLITVYHYLASKKIKRIGLMGHSIGGAVCLLAANYIRIQSLVILSPVSQRLFYNHFLTPKLSDRNFLKSFDFYPRHSFKRGKYYPVGIKFFKDFENQPLDQEVKNIKKPLLIIHAGADRAVSLADSRRLLAALSFDIIGLKIIKNAEHNLDKSKEIRQVINLSLNWFNKHLKKKRDDVMTVFLRRRDDKILIVKRSRKLGTHPGYWHGVGGYLATGERPQETALREIQEELNINRRFINIIKVAPPYRWQEERYDKDWNVYYILAETAKTKIKLDWEAEKFKWIQPGDMLKYKTVPHLDVGLKRLDLI